MLCDHYKLHQKTLKANLTPEQREEVDSLFRARLAELLVLRLKGDSHAGPKVVGAAHDEAGSSKGDGSYSGEEEGEGGEEEEDEGGSDAEDEEESDAEDSSEDGSDSAENKDASDGAESDDAPEVGDTLPSTSVYGRLVLRIRKAIHTEVPQTPKPLKNMESRDKQVPRVWRAKRCATIRDLSASGSGSDMDLGGSSGNEAVVAGPSAEEEKLMKESSDSQLMAVDNEMLPDHVESRPGGNRYSLSV